jgi:ferredoxin
VHRRAHRRDDSDKASKRTSAEKLIQANCNREETRQLRWRCFQTSKCAEKGRAREEDTWSWKCVECWVCALRCSTERHESKNPKNAVVQETPYIVVHKRARRQNASRRRIDGGKDEQTELNHGPSLCTSVHSEVYDNTYKHMRAKRRAPSRHRSEGILVDKACWQGTTHKLKSTTAINAQTCFIIMHNRAFRIRYDITYTHMRAKADTLRTRGNRCAQACTPTRHFKAKRQRDQSVKQTIKARC